jgi:hypothetical protein
MTDATSQGQATDGDHSQSGGDQPAGSKIDVSSLKELKTLADATTHDAVAAWLGVTPPAPE